MASGKKNYFRHSFFARNDDFIIDLMDEFGFHGYFMWFTLLEVCGESASDSYPEKFVLHESRLMKDLRCNRHKLNLFLTYAQLKSRISVAYVDNRITLEIHNFRKYLGKYENLNQSNTPNKRKEKERKEKESKVNTITPDEVMNIWNNAYGERFGYCPGFGGGQHRDNVLESIKYLDTASKWEDLFLKASSSRFLSGQEGSGWTVNLLWLVDYDNALKVISGNFDDTKNLKHLFAGIPND